MRNFFTLLWLLCPVAAVYYHYNEGQDQLVRVEARRHVEAIRKMERAAGRDLDDGPLASQPTMSRLNSQYQAKYNASDSLAGA